MRSLPVRHRSYYSKSAGTGKAEDGGFTTWQTVCWFSFTSASCTPAIRRARRSPTSTRRSNHSRANTTTTWINLQYKQADRDSVIENLRYKYDVVYQDRVIIRRIVERGILRVPLILRSAPQNRRTIKAFLAYLAGGVRGCHLLLRTGPSRKGSKEGPTITVCRDYWTWWRTRIWRLELN